MGNHDCTVFAPEEFTRLSGLQIAPCSWVAGDVALHFLNANFDWQGKPYRPGAVDWTQTRLPEEELARVRAAMADTAHRHFFFLHQCLDPGVEQRHILQNAAEINALLQTRTHSRRVSRALPSWLSQRAQWHPLCYIGCAVRGDGKQRHGHRYRCFSRLERRGPAMQYGHNNQKAQEVVYDLDKRRIFGAYDL